MSKKGDIINTFLEEKELYQFKSGEWVEKRDRIKKASSKHTKNLKQICANDPYGEELGSY